jgi:hypothetical protein
MLTTVGRLATALIPQQQPRHSRDSSHIRNSGNVDSRKNCSNRRAESSTRDKCTSIDGNSMVARTSGKSSIRREANHGREPAKEQGH